MNIPRKMTTLAVALVIAVPVSIAAAIAGPTLIASAGGAPALPAMCNIGATVNFSPPLQMGGSVSTTAGLNETTTVTGITLSHCISSNSLGAPSGGHASNLTITSPEAKCSPAKNGCASKNAQKQQQYTNADCASFASTSTLKELKGISFAITWTSEPETGGTLSTTTSTKKAGGTAGPGGELGFILQGADSGDYADSSGQSVAYVSLTGSGNNNGANLLAGCPSGPVSSVTIDATSSTVSI